MSLCLLGSCVANKPRRSCTRGSRDSAGASRPVMTTCPPAGRPDSYSPSGSNPTASMPSVRCSDSPRVYAPPASKVDPQRGSSITPPVPTGPDGRTTPETRCLQHAPHQAAGSLRSSPESCSSREDRPSRPQSRSYPSVTCPDSQEHGVPRAISGCILREQISLIRAGMMCALIPATYLDS